MRAYEFIKEDSIDLAPNKINQKSSKKTEDIYRWMRVPLDWQDKIKNGSKVKHLWSTTPDSQKPVNTKTTSNTMLIRIHGRVSRSDVNDFDSLIGTHNISNDEHHNMDEIMLYSGAIIDIVDIVDVNGTKVNTDISTLVAFAKDPDSVFQNRISDTVPRATDTIVKSRATD